ncbi:aldehyde dehydrogenase [Exidia glandulosa HHB12029]|uniref:Aldehyde dehydrogenase n=1 Tax=Exidia glandulosa HHB12029 TaxID=1314781 RepID=A0A165HB59_EXIGL|nr:aldehyde dehydrogenase [Exidia glandulosa HHB12029]
MTLLSAPLFINGEHRAASDGKTYDVRNPLTNEVVCTSAAASSDDCRAAVESAAQAFKTWEHTPLATKRRIFLKAAELFASPKYQEIITSTVTSETAAAKEMMHANIYGSVTWSSEAAALTSQLKGETFPSQVPGGQCIVQRRAHGVVFCISPWNAPVNLAMRSIAVAIICGNTVVLKSSEASPASQAIVTQVLKEAGLPDGVLNYISMAKEDAPRLTAELIAHPLVRKVTFTGSSRVGKIIAGEAAKYLKPCVFELGGKAPAVVLEDADVEHAARAIISGAMLNSGQICMSTERVIAHRAVAEKLLANLSTVAAQLKAGNPATDAAAKLSAVFTEQSAESVVAKLRDAVQNGARLVLGDLSNVGAVVQPHVLADVRPGMQAWDHESFGPVVVVAVVDTVDEAVELANATEYSFTASIWTENLYKALDVAQRIRFGAVMINGSTVHTEPGMDHAGLGGATGYGRFDIENFTDKRLIVVCPKDGKYPLTG